MRHLAAAAVAFGLAACATADPAGGEPDPSYRYTFWRPAPVESAPEPAKIVAQSDTADWQAIDPENLLLVDLTDGRSFAIELAPEFAPVHVANVRAFARAGWWDGASVYRVQDNYVAQWGNGDADVPLPQGVERTPPAEYTRSLEGLVVRPLGFPDSYAAMAGHVSGWPVAYDPEGGEAWLTHCYGSVGVGRGLSPDTGTGGELYAVIGHSPRHLDRNIAVVGRVIDGMPALSANPRGSGNLGFYDEEKGERPVPIARARLASAVPEGERPQYEVMRTDTEAFAAYVTGRANRGGDFFIRPAGGIDVCNVNVPVRRRTSR